MRTTGSIHGAVRETPPIAKLRRAAAATLLACALSGCGPGEARSMARVVAPDGTERLRVAVDLAEDEVARRTGLRGRAALPAGEGLLILLPVEGEVCLANAGVAFAIDAVFAAASGAVTAIESHIAAGDPEPRCHAGVERILEVGAGEAGQVRSGDLLLVD